MARAKYDADEFDGAFKVEQGIARALEEDGRAVVTFDALEDVYEIVNDDGETLPGDLDAKCAFLCRKLQCACKKNPEGRECVFLRQV